MGPSQKVDGWQRPPSNMSMDVLLQNIVSLWVLGYHIYISDLSMAVSPARLPNRCPFSGPKNLQQSVQVAI